jgi:hypothetical protein
MNQYLDGPELPLKGALVLVVVGLLIFAICYYFAVYL